MPTIVFWGHVIPSVMKFTLSEPMTTTWPYPEINLDMKFITTVNNSRIRVICELNRFVVEEIIYVLYRATVLARTAVNMICFAGGYSATVSMDYIIPPNTPSEPLWFHDPEIGKMCTAYGINTDDAEANKNFSFFYTLVTLDPALAKAIDDLIVGISVFDQNLVNCARALDAIRKLIAPVLADNPKKGWSALQSALNCSEPYLSFISEHSKELRHGSYRRVEGDITRDVVIRTWKIMNRYLELRKRQVDSLPLDEFPLLA